MFIKNNILGKTTCSIINGSVISLFNKLQTDRYADSTRIPKIILNIPTAQCVSNLLPPSTTPINTTESFPFLQVSSLQLGIVLIYELTYPTHCNFYLEGYYGTEDSDIFASNIIPVASKNRTSSKIETNDHFKARPNK